MDKWIDGRVNEWMGHAYICICIYAWADRCIDGWIDGLMDVCIYGWMDGRVNEWMGHACVCICIYAWAHRCTCVPR